MCGLTPMATASFFLDGIAVASFCKDKNLDQEDPRLRKGGSSGVGVSGAVFF